MMAWLVKRHLKCVFTLHNHMTVLKNLEVSKKLWCQDNNNKISPAAWNMLKQIRTYHGSTSELKTATPHAAETIAIRTLCKILCITKCHAEKVVEQNPNLKILSSREILKNFQELRKKGIYKSTIVDNKYLLAFSTKELEQKMECLKQVDSDINNMVPLVKLGTFDLKISIERLKNDKYTLSHNTRIEYLAEKLECEPLQLCHLLVTNTNLLKLPIQEIVKKTEYLLESKFSPANILNDLHAYEYSMEKMRLGVYRAQIAGLTELKPWIFRIAPEKWAKIVVKNKTGMIDTTREVREETVSEIFNCDRKLVKFAFSQNKLLATTKMNKLIDMLRLLRDAGYTIVDVMRSGPLMFHSYSKIENRFRVWKESGLPQLPLGTYTLNEENFKKYLDNKLLSKDQFSKENK